jgi:hypothetical protein
MRLGPLMVCCATLSCAGSKWRRPIGPLQVFVTGGLIAPGKSNGNPWDGPGSLPPEVSRAAVRGLQPTVSHALLGLMPGLGGLRALASVAPEIASLMTGAYETPDVRLSVTLNGRPIGDTGVAQDSLEPTWPSRPLDVGVVPPGSFLEFRAIDSDLMFDDDIGICTITGAPLIDADGYVAPESFRCSGQLWGLVVRVVEVPIAP